MKRAGLFAYLKSLSSGMGETAGDRRDVIATVFGGVTNRMINGYLLRDVINKVNTIHFTSSDEIHTLGALYESTLREMRDAAGDSGEFYTPRAVVRLMVAVTDPRLGEVVLDPACGTGGFLVEAYTYLEKQVKTVEDRATLQTRSLSGVEPKPLPYLLAQMNLLLHGLEAPRTDPNNALRFKLGEIGDPDRVDIILTNPPFGGEEERGIQDNFPADKRASETALLFLQLIMRRLRRPSATHKPGRAAVVVPNGTLFGDGVAARIKQELLTEFNLHTIVRLPNGVFAPYTSIPTNILFFDRSGPTREVWYYEQPLPDGRRQYTKTARCASRSSRPGYARCSLPDTPRPPTTKPAQTPAVLKVDALTPGVHASLLAGASPYPARYPWSSSPNGSPGHAISCGSHPSAAATLRIVPIRGCAPASISVIVLVETPAARANSVALIARFSRVCRSVNRCPGCVTPRPPASPRYTVHTWLPAASDPIK